MKIQKVMPYAVNVSEKTNWFFLKLETDDGLAGWGEASLSGGWEENQMLNCKRLAEMITGKTIDEALPLLTVFPHAVGGLVWNSILSAAEMALMDIKARAAGVPIHRLFGTPLRDTIRVYGNINRAATDRSPQGFAALARDRAAQGYTAFKLAPFDGVFWADLGDAEVRKKYQQALDCIFAVRDAVGPDAGVLIDCHWRFDEPTALQLLRDLAPAKLFWAECLTSERAEHHPVLGRVRRAAEDMGVLVAGGERQIGVLGFEPLLRAKLLDVVMPDIKYTGGYTGMLAVANRAHECGVKFSPHNPTGPVCNMASLHACALSPNFLILERQSEGSVYDEIFTGDHPKLVNGSYAVPQSPGLGIVLNEDALKARPPVKPRGESTADPRLG
jgi:galactonate dehydratase